MAQIPTEIQVALILCGEAHEDASWFGFENGVAVNPYGCERYIYILMKSSEYIMEDIVMDIN